MNLSKKIIAGLFFGVVQLFSMHRSIKKHVVKKPVDGDQVVVTWNPFCEVPDSPVPTDVSDSIEETDKSPLTIGSCNERVYIHYQGYSECMRRDFETQKAKQRKEFFRQKIEEAKLREAMLRYKSIQSVCEQCQNVKDCLYCGRSGASDLGDVGMTFSDEK